MINQDRIRLMTRMAAYEAHESHKDDDINSYFRSDYMSLQMIKSVFYGTVGFLIVFAMFIYYDFDTYMAGIYQMDLIEFAKQVGMYYLISVVAYCVISYIVYSVKYYRTKRRLKKYYQRLKQLSAMYDLERRRTARKEL